MFWAPCAGFAIIAIISVGLAWSISAGSLQRNQAVGIRTRHTLHSDAAWAAGHAAARGAIIAMAVVAAACGGGLAAIELSGAAASLGNVVAIGGYAAILLVAVVAALVANRAAQNADAG